MRFTCQYRAGLFTGGQGHAISVGSAIVRLSSAGRIDNVTVALSLVYPSDDPRLEGELTRLRELLSAEVPTIAGGRATPAYRHTLDKIAAFQMKDLTQLCDTLDGLRAPAKTAKR